MSRNQIKYQGRARKRDANEPGIVAALEAAGATVVELDKPVDLLVGYGSDTDLLEVKNGNQPPSWQRVTPDQVKFFKAWKGKRARIVTTMREALETVGVPAGVAAIVLDELAADYDAAGEPLGKNRAKL